MLNRTREFNQRQRQFSKRTRAVQEALGGVHVLTATFFDNLLTQYRKTGALPPHPLLKDWVLMADEFAGLAYFHNHYNRFRDGVRGYRVAASVLDYRLRQMRKDSDGKFTRSAGSTISAAH